MYDEATPYVNRKEKQVPAKRSQVLPTKKIQLKEIYKT
jgi:hypothetical protein